MSDEKDQKVEKTADEWRASLSPEAYRVARCGGTEPAFTGKYWNTKTTGTYCCACCGAALFDSGTKYDSGTGWPSFYEPSTPDAIASRDDVSHGMARIEALCRRCDAHLGHVFPDGPEPTGMRYCINSASLKLEPSDSSSY